ncbi:zinc-ribbon domain-containing protein [Rhodococcus sp. UNC363MFTsu5.1]|uniref:zinc-ribbon domain-containing protein n=1 Tax=Rhodococcus sp. UNC363MFTsu5.1 TaxID=1449069 RepID=UPI000A45C7A1
MPKGLLAPGSSLAELFPDQAAEWHPTLNGALLPQDVTARSNRKVWWSCSICDTSWQAIIGNRTKNASVGCRTCSQQRTTDNRNRARPGESLADLYPDLAIELHPDLNEGRTAHTIRPSLHKKVWWRCRQCDHEFEMAPRIRTAAPFSGCPPCSYRRAGEKLRRPTQGQSLADLHPEIAATWHPAKNASAAADVIAGSAIRAWWLCPACGHAWQTSVSNRTAGKRTGCPKCSRAMQQQAPKGQSIADLYAELVEEWHPTRNGDLVPNQVKPGSSSFKIWWICKSCGHEWQATPLSRCRAGTGCAPCSYVERTARRDTPKPNRSLAGLFPELIDEWDHSRNGNLDPKTLKPGSDRKVWWRCQSHGHSWQTHIYQRTGSQRTGCPDCVHRPEPGRSFAELNPAAALEWHPTRNGKRRPEEFKPSSSHRAWWKCRARGHVWQTTITNRSGSNASSCPTCTMWGTSATQIRLTYELIAAGVPIDPEHPKIPVNGRRPVSADIVIPSLLTIVEYDGSHHHASESGLVQDRRQSGALMEAGWTVLRVRPKPLELLDEYSIRVKNSPAVKEIAIAVLCRLDELGHRAEHHDRYIVDPDQWATAQADSRVLNYQSRSLADEFPDLAAEWHPTKNGARTPENTNPGSKIHAWWLCSRCGNEWRTRPGHRTNNASGCPRCAREDSAIRRRQAKVGESMADAYPHLLTIFNRERNPGVDMYAINPGTTKEIWWLCPDCEHEWSTRNARNTGCRPCASKRRAKKRVTPAPGKSLVDLYPQIAAEWHPDKNAPLSPRDIRPRFASPVWWQCRCCGREWQRSPGRRVANGSGCRQCASQERGRSRRSPGAGESVADQKPDLAAEWHESKNGELRPEDIKPSSSERVWWRCGECGNEWRALVWARARKGHGCKKCASVQLSAARRRPRPGLSLAERHPAIAAQWHPGRNGETTPDGVSHGSSTNYWWLCAECGHEWQAKPSNRRTQVHLCPKCKRRSASE